MNHISLTEKKKSLIDCSLCYGKTIKFHNYSLKRRITNTNYNMTKINKSLYVYVSHTIYIILREKDVPSSIFLSIGIKI